MSHDPQITISGNVGKDAPRVVNFPDGGKLADFSMGYTPQKRTDSGWSDLPTVWMTVEAKKTLADRVEAHVTPGTLVIVTGTLRADEWVTEDGQKRSKLKLIASDIGLHLHGKRFSSPQSQGAYADAGSLSKNQWQGESRQQSGGWQSGDGAQQWGQNPGQGGWGQ